MGPSHFSHFPVYVDFIIETRRRASPTSAQLWPGRQFVKFWLLWLWALGSAWGVTLPAGLADWCCQCSEPGHQGVLAQSTEVLFNYIDYNSCGCGATFMTGCCCYCNCCCCYCCCCSCIYSVASCCWQQSN